MAVPKVSALDAAVPESCILPAGSINRHERTPSPLQRTDSRSTAGTGDTVRSCTAPALTTVEMKVSVSELNTQLPPKSAETK